MRLLRAVAGCLIIVTAPLRQRPMTKFSQGNKIAVLCPLRNQQEEMNTA
jgi:hypothetical protein